MNDYVSVMMSTVPYGFGVGFGIYIIASLIGFAIRSGFNLIKKA